MTTPPAFDEYRNTPKLPPGDIEMTVSNHHELLIRMDERLKTFVTREDLLNLEKRLTEKIAFECGKTARDSHTLIKWCIGTIAAAIIALIGTSIFGYLSLTKEQESTVKLFVVSETLTHSSVGAEAREIPKDVLDARLDPELKQTH